MNILEINKFYYLRRGAERHMLDCIDLFESKGHDVAVFSMRHPKNLPSEWEKFFVSYVGYNAKDSNIWQKMIGVGRLFWSFEARRKIRELLKVFRPDVVHMHNIYHQISPSILGPLRKSGAKIVMTVHDYNLISPDKDAYYPEIGKAYWKFLGFPKYSFPKRLLLVLKMYFERAFDFYGRAIDRYIAPSEYVRNALMQGGIDPEKISVIPHFAEQAGEFSGGEEIKDKGYALYFGSLSEEKGIPGLVRMFDDLEMPLVLAGACEPGFDIPRSKRVTCVGMKNRMELEKLIRESSCVVSGSMLPETFGLVVLEAICHGKPFFGLKSGAYSEIVTNGENGFLASDFEEFRSNLRSFFLGVTVFDPGKIRRDAHKKYGAESYYEMWLKATETV